MQDLIGFFQTNGPWIFGSGGAVVALLAILKVFGGKKDATGPGATRINAGDNAQINTGTSTSGLDGAWVALIVVALACLAGFSLTVGGDRITASGDGAVIINNGTGNTVGN